MKIVLVFQGVGKTYLASNNPDIVDCDVKEYRGNNWVSDYADALIGYEADPSIKHVLGNISNDIMDELLARGYLFDIVAPVWDDTVRDEPDELAYTIIKERLIGRYVLRKTQTSKNSYWIERMKRFYNDWTRLSFFNPYVQKGCVLKNICDIPITDALNLSNYL